MPSNDVSARTADEKPMIPRQMNWVVPVRLSTYLKSANNVRAEHDAARQHVIGDKIRTPRRVGKQQQKVRIRAMMIDLAASVMRTLNVVVSKFWGCGGGRTFP
jgi:hypothetical protein